MTGDRIWDAGFEIGERSSQAILRALNHCRTDAERKVVVMAAIGAPLAQAGAVFAQGDPMGKERVLTHVTIAALAVARCAGRKPGDPDPIEAAMEDYRALVAAGRMPPLDGGGA